MLSLEDDVVLVATGNSAAMERLLRPHVRRAVVANSRLVRAIAYARVKTDKIDAAILTKLHAAGFLPEVWIADDATLTQRRQVAERTVDRRRVLADGLSDERCEYLIKDRLSFMRFLGLGLADPVPDANTIWTFGEAIKRPGAVDALFARFDATLRCHAAGERLPGVCCPIWAKPIGAASSASGRPWPQVTTPQHWKPPATSSTAW